MRVRGFFKINSFLMFLLYAQGKVKILFASLLWFGWLSFLVF